jgi:uncharacterized protein (TIGR03118 family)
MNTSSLLIVGLLLAVHVPAAFAQNSYVQTNLVSDLASDNPEILDSDFHDSWGIALRPPGAGGHIWINNAENGTSDEFIGDVGGNPLHQDALQSVTIDAPTFTDHGYSFDTGIVYNSASDADAAAGLQDLAYGTNPSSDIYEFGLYNQTAYVNNNPDNTTTYTGPAKFAMCTEDGCINAWASNTATAMPSAPIMVDYSKEGNFGDAGLAANAVYSGMAMTENLYSTSSSSAFVTQGGNHIFATDFRNNVIEVFNDQWQDVTSTYKANGAFTPPANILDNPFADAATPGSNPHVALRAFNITDIGGNLYVAYGMFYAAGDEGMEEQDGQGLGAVCEFSETGQLIREFNDEGQLDAPWGMVIAPASFGAYGGDLLVTNFGSGYISAFDTTTGDFVGNLDDPDGNPINIDGIWGLTFGNGVSLGGSNTLYFTAGTNNEVDGLFGSLNVSTGPVPEPGSIAFLGVGLLGLIAAGGRLRRKA